MTNLERYQRILTRNLKLTDEPFDDEVLMYNKHPKWDSITHMDMITELEDEFDIQFETLDITSFSTYTKGIAILKKLGVDM